MTTLTRPEPSSVRLTVQDQMRRVLDLMSLGSIRRFINEIEEGHIEGSEFGGTFENVLTSSPEQIARTPFTGCFLGWAGFLEQRSVLDIGAELGWTRSELGTTDLEGFVQLIHEGDTPENDPDSAALYIFVTGYLALRLFTQEGEKQNATV